MKDPKPTPLSFALRVYPEPAGSKRNPKSPKPWKCPNAMLVFDTETRTDATQRLTFGSYRYFEAGRCLEEGLFYADDLPDADRRVLEQYVATHRPETASDGVRDLKLLTRSQFVDKFYQAVYKGRCLLVGFNLPFDTLANRVRLYNRAGPLRWWLLSRAMDVYGQERAVSVAIISGLESASSTSTASAPSRASRRGTARIRRT